MQNITMTGLTIMYFWKTDTMFTKIRKIYKIFIYGRNNGILIRVYIHIIHCVQYCTAFVDIIRSFTGVTNRMVIKIRTRDEMSVLPHFCFVFNSQLNLKYLFCQQIMLGMLLPTMLQSS